MKRYFAGLLFIAAIPFGSQKIHRDRYEEAASRYGINSKWLMALALIESDMNQHTVSRVGAIGVMQIMPETARECGVDPYDYDSNIDCGARVFAENIRRFGRLDLAVAAYNDGPNAVRRYGGIPPYRETQRHVIKFKKALRMIQ